LFFGSLTASAGVFLYDSYTDTQLRNEIVALDTAIANFSNEKMEEVKTFNTRLIQAKDRLSSSVSTVSIFESLEASTAQAVSIEELTLKRVEDEKFLIEANLNTDTFDSALFQRGLYERNPIIETVSFEDVSLGQADSEKDAPRSGVSFKTEIGVLLSSILYQSEEISVPVEETNIVEMSTTTVSTTTVSTTTTGEIISGNESEI
jgi:hypothetical protein